MKAIPEGFAAEFTTRVTPEMTVNFEELGRVHPVYATYWLARHMELAGRKVLLGFLEEGEEGIGQAVSVDHLALALPGMQITVQASHAYTQGNRVVCQCLAHNQLGDLIGRGQTVQVVLPQKRLDQLFDQLRKRWQLAQG
jgi:fluoroacetyl-CoA thioesterase